MRDRISGEAGSACEATACLHKHERWEKLKVSTNGICRPVTVVALIAKPVVKQQWIQRINLHTLQTQTWLLNLSPDTDENALRPAWDHGGPGLRAPVHSGQVDWPRFCNMRKSSTLESTNFHLASQSLSPRSPQRVRQPSRICWVDEQRPVLWLTHSNKSLLKISNLYSTQIPRNSTQIVKLMY